MDRIHLIVPRAEKERFRQSAARQGQSLSEWLRTAAHEKLAAAERASSLDSPETLRAFFLSCNEAEAGQEPDWEEHRQIIDRSVSRGATVT